MEPTAAEDAQPAPIAIDSPTKVNLPDAASRTTHAAGYQCKTQSSAHNHVDVTKTTLVSIALHLVFLTCALLLVSDGSYGILMHGYGRLDKINTRFLLEKSDIAAKGVYAQEMMHKLRGSHVPRFSSETYPDCLVRGINIAHDYFNGIDLGQHPQVQEEVISWTEENCRQLHFLPRAFLYPGTGYLKGMARAKEALLTHIVHIKEWLAKRVRSRLAVLLGEERPIQMTKARSEPESMHFYMPRYFTLTDCDTPPCRLVYNNPQSQPVRTQAPDQALLETFQQEYSRLQGVITYFRPVFIISKMALGFLLTLNPLFQVGVLTKHCVDWAPIPILAHSLVDLPPVYTHYLVGMFVLGLHGIFFIGVTKLDAILPLVVYMAFFSMGVTSILAFVFSSDFSPLRLSIKSLLHDVRTLGVEMGYLQSQCNEQLIEESPNNPDSRHAVPEAAHSANTSPSQERCVSSFGQDLVEAIKKREEQATGSQLSTLTTAFMDVDLHSDSDIEDTEFVDAAESDGNTSGSDSDSSIVIVTGD